MKKIFYVFLLITGLASCKYVGGGKSTNVSSDIDSGFLISKKPFDFDIKFVCNNLGLDIANVDFNTYNRPLS
jgi:hypothetical protein